MQTPAESHLIELIRDHLLGLEGPGPHLVLDIGAGRSDVVEQELIGAGCSFLCDRIDVEDCTLESPAVRHCWRCSVEKMEPLESGVYSAAFANYVLEHVADLDGAASEIFRVLKPGGLFVTSLPNLTAPEFVIARHAPPGLQKAMTRGKGFHTCYAWKTIADLARVFEAAGLVTREVRYWAFTESYLWQYPVLRHLSRLYDRIVSGMGAQRLMGNVCVTFRKP